MAHIVSWGIVIYCLWLGLGELEKAIRGKERHPECEDDFVGSKSQMKHVTCYKCDKPFEGIKMTPAGWRETQITGLCEPCFDYLFKEE